MLSDRALARDLLPHSAVGLRLGYARAGDRDPFIRQAWGAAERAKTPRSSKPPRLFDATFFFPFGFIRFRDKVIAIVEIFIYLILFYKVLVNVFIPEIIHKLIIFS